MDEVKVLSEDLNGLGWTVKSLLDQNLEKAEVRRAASGIKGSLAITETGAGVSVTLLFELGELAIQNDVIEKPSARLAGDFEGLSEVISGQTGPIRALLTGKIKAGGNLLKLLRMARAIISRDDD